MCDLLPCSVQQFFHVNFKMGPTVDFFEHHDTDDLGFVERYFSIFLIQQDKNEGEIHLVFIQDGKETQLYHIANAILTITPRNRYPDQCF